MTHQRENRRFWLTLLLALYLVSPTTAQDVKKSPVYTRIKAYIDSVPAIDTHEHLRAFDELPGRVKTSDGTVMNLQSVWRGSYFGWTSTLSAWPADGKFNTWWNKAQHDFDNARALSFYRYLLPAFRDLYNVDFDTITPQQAARLNAAITQNYRNDQWLKDVVTKRANIELMLIDPYWSRLQFRREYRFSVPVLNVTTMMQGSHPERFASDLDSVYAYAKNKKLATKTFDDYLKVVEAIFQEAVESDAVCLKSTQAYQRSLTYRPVSKKRAAAAYGKAPSMVTANQQREFEDFMFWHVCKLSAKYQLPFQVHTGQARVQGSNPMLLVDVIAANHQTKFILFHGGFPWIGETGVIAMRHRNVYIDSCWLPTLSYTTAKRAYQEWLEVVPSNRIMWGADTVNAEGIYAATEFTRQCLAEALAEKVARGELPEKQAFRIGKQIMRDNALELFPKMKRMLWRKNGNSE